MSAREFTGSQLPRQLPQSQGRHLAVGVDTPAQRPEPAPPVKGAHVDGGVAGGGPGDVPATGQHLQGGLPELQKRAGNGVRCCLHLFAWFAAELLTCLLERK